MELTPAHRAEVVRLANTFGEPRRADAFITNDFFDPIHRPDRFGEVCMVVRRPNGKLLLAIKTFYPRGAYRLPTGGNAHDEPIPHAPRRGTEEETGLRAEGRSFLAQDAHRPPPSPRRPPLFHPVPLLPPAAR